MDDVIRIVPPQGADGITTGRGTQVFTASGEEIQNITRIEIDPLSPDSVLTARISVAVALADVHAHPLLSRNSLEEAAEAYGCELVPKGHYRSVDLATGATRWIKFPE